MELYLQKYSDLRTPALCQARGAVLLSSSCHGPLDRRPVDRGGLLEGEDGAAQVGVVPAATIGRDLPAGTTSMTPPVL